MSMDSQTRFSQLTELAQNMGLMRLAETWRKTESSQDRNKINVVIIGEFNHGKSSLLNGMIGDMVLPFGVTPTTQLDTWITFHADKKHVRAFSCGEEIADWTWDEWMGMSNRCMPEVLKDKSVDRLLIETDSNVFDENCIFIDTPGMNEAFLARESYLKRYLNRADLLIFVLDANQALTHTEQTIMRELAGSLKPEQRIIAINKCDRLDDDEWLEICHYVEQTLAPMIGDERFYMVSAKKKKVGDWDDMITRIQSCIESSKNNHSEDALDRQINEMKLNLEGFLMIYRALEQMPAEMRTSIFASSRGKSLSSIQLAEILQDVSNELNRLERQVVSEIDRFKADFLRAMPRELDKSPLDVIEKFFEDFIDDEYAQFSSGAMNRLVENMNDVICRSLREILPNEFPAFSMALKMVEVEHLRKNPVSTGTFDSSGALGLWSLPLPGVIANKAERPRREAIRKMAENAIVMRAGQYSHAFEQGVQHLQDVVSTFMREHGLQLLGYVQEMLTAIEKGADIDESVI